MKRGLMKRSAAALCAAVLAVSMLAGCTKTDYSMTADGDKINAGVYINYLLTEMTSQMYSMYYAQEISDPKEALEKDVEGENFKKYVKDKAIKDTKEFAAINAKFKELGLKLTKEQKAEIEDSVSSSWEESGEFYESEGVSRESLKQINELSYKRQAIFEYYYYEGGIEEVTEDDLKTYVKDNYIRYKQISFTKETAAGEDEDVSAKNEEIKAKADEYLAKAKETDYEGFDALIDEYKAEQEAEEAAAAEEETSETETAETETAEVEDSTAAEETSSDESAAEDTSETSDESLTEVDGTVSQAEAAAEETADSTEVTAETEESAAEDGTADEAADSAEDSEAAEGEVDVADLTTDDSIEIEDLTGEDSEETEEVDNDTVVNYTTGIDTESESYSEDYANRLKAFKEAEFGKAGLYEDDSAYYVYMTADITEKEGYTTDNHDTLVEELKSDEFQKLIDGWVEKMSISVNQKAVKRYTVQEVYDRQEKYYSENQG